MLNPTRLGRASFCLLNFLLVLAWAVHPARGQAAESHCLWKVQGPSTTVHLLGSIHLLKKEDYPLPAGMEEAFTHAQIVAFEADIDLMDDPKQQTTLLTKAKLPLGQTLADQISKETYAKLAAHLKEADVPGGTLVFDGFRPWFVAVGLLALELPALGLDPKYGVDKHYFARAREARKTVLPLETIEFQLNLFADLNKADEQALLESTLKDIKNVRKMLTELVGAWQKGDATKLDQLLNQALAEEPRLYRRLVTDRNRQWLTEIEKLLSGNKPAMVIVGAAHLIGKDGVVDLLQKKGFKVVQE